jgi:hypothetical protein
MGIDDETYCLFENGILLQPKSLGHIVHDKNEVMSTDDLPISPRCFFGNSHSAISLAARSDRKISTLKLQRRTVMCIEYYVI